MDAALTALVGDGHHVLLTADAGPEERYRRWLAVSRGAVRAVVGTRAAMFAPVADLGLVALWDDGDSSHAEPHAPQPHARDVLLLRAREERTAFLLGGVTGTVEGAQLVDSGWALPLAASRDEVRAAAPLIRTVGDADQARDEAARAARLPSLAWRAVRDALAAGPVLVQVPRRGRPRRGTWTSTGPSRSASRVTCQASDGQPGGPGRRVAGLVRVARPYAPAAPRPAPARGRRSAARPSGSRRVARPRR